jgi:hypothetical protein
VTAAGNNSADPATPPRLPGAAQTPRALRERARPVPVVGARNSPKARSAWPRTSERACCAYRPGRCGRRTARTAQASPELGMSCIVAAKLGIGVPEVAVRECLYMAVAQAPPSAERDMPSGNLVMPAPLPVEEVNEGPGQLPGMDVLPGHSGEPDGGQQQSSCPTTPRTPPGRRSVAAVPTDGGTGSR